MKKKYSYLLIVCFLIGTLSGCKNDLDIYLPYEVSNHVLEIQNSNYITQSKLFSNDLCFIPVGTDNSQDGNLQALGTMLVDITDQKVIYANNVYEKLYPASITKIVTALVVLKYGNLQDTVIFSHNAANITETGAKKCGFKEGDQILLEDLLNCFLVYSGNDAGIALAEHIAGTEEEFAKLMNKEANVLGATQSNFVNSHGLHDDNHYTTVYDIYLIFNEMIKNDVFLSIIQKDSCEVVYKDKNGVEQKSKKFDSTNRYLKNTVSMPEGITVLGGKTGTTSKAGSCLILLNKDDQEHQYLSFIFHANDANVLYSQMTYLLKLAKR